MLIVMMSWTTTSVHDDINTSSTHTYEDCYIEEPH